MNAYPTDDTIAAIASAAGGAFRGVVRISGPATLEILAGVVCGVDLVGANRPSIAAVRRGAIRLAADSCELPADLYLWPDARSYTRQPAAEIHMIGSPPLLTAVLEAVCNAGARLAYPGEFTLRAFLAGRLDLTQAEAVLGVIDARGPAELHVALRQLAGGMALPLSKLRDRLLDLLARLEAGLDFVEEDIEFVSRQEVDDQLANAQSELQQARRQLVTRHQDASEPRVAIVGCPNVGKSSLFNALAGRTAALVSDLAGTTRDFLAADLVYGSQRFRLVDTAGYEWPMADDGVASQAQQLSREVVDQCDVELLCLDSTRSLNTWERQRLARISDRPRIVVGTKCDAARSTPAAELHLGTIGSSAISGQGLDEVRHAIGAVLAELQGRSASSLLTAERCSASLAAAAEALEHARQINQANGGEELLAAELRLCLEHLGQVVGTVYTDDILDRVFSRFCIGK